VQKIKTVTQNPVFAPSDMHRVQTFVDADPATLHAAYSDEHLPRLSAAERARLDAYEPYTFVHYQLAQSIGALSVLAGQDPFRPLGVY
jgi:hypothetical protein